jgi:peroxiredoxin
MAYDRSAHPLDTCDMFPDIVLETLDHGAITIPRHFGAHWGVVLFYRGVWCGYCRNQMTEFQRALPDIEARNARVVAVSVDSEADARKMVEYANITFPVAYGVDVLEIATSIGCFYEETDRFLQKSGFVLRPGGEIARANYSTGPTGALTAADALKSLDFFQTNPEHRTGILRPVAR